MATLGQKFKKAREKKGVSQSKAAAATRMKIQLVEAMEEDDFSSMAAPAYAKGFIKLYAEYLELESQPLIDEYMEKHSPGPPVSGLAPASPNVQWKKQIMTLLLRAWAYLKAVPHRKLMAQLWKIILVVVVLLSILVIFVFFRACGSLDLYESEPQNLSIIQEPSDPYIKK